MDFQHLLDDLYLQLNDCRLHPRESVARFNQLKGSYQGNLFKGQVKTRQGVHALQNLIQDLVNRNPNAKRLKWSFALHMAADQQATILGQKGLFTTEGTSFNRTLPQRIKDYAIVKGRIAEVYQFGGRTPAQILDQLLIDDGLASRKRRTTLLDPIFNYVGIGSSYHESNESCTVIILAQDIVSLVAPDTAGKYKRRRGIESGRQNAIKLTNDILLTQLFGKSIPGAIIPGQNQNNPANISVLLPPQSQPQNQPNPSIIGALLPNQGTNTSNISNVNQPVLTNTSNQPGFILDSRSPSYQTSGGPNQTNLSSSLAQGTNAGETVTYVNTNNTNTITNTNLNNNNMNSSINLNNSNVSNNTALNNLPGQTVTYTNRNTNYIQPANTNSNINATSNINPLNNSTNYNAGTSSSINNNNINNLNNSTSINANTSTNLNNINTNPNNTINNNIVPQTVSYINRNTDNNAYILAGSTNIPSSPINPSSTPSQLQQQQYQLYKNENVLPNTNTNINTNTNSINNINDIHSDPHIANYGSSSNIGINPAFGTMQNVNTSANIGNLQPAATATTGQNLATVPKQESGSKCSIM